MKHPRLILAFVALLLSLVPLLWFSSGYAILGADLGWLGLDRIENFFEHLFTWKNAVAFGLDGSSLVPPTLTLNFFLYLTDIVGLSFIAAEKMLFVGIMLLLNVSAGFVVCQATVRERVGVRLVACISAMLFFTLNFFLGILWHNLIIGLLLAIATSLLLLGIFIKATLNQDARFLPLVLSIGGISFLTSVFGMNPPAVIGIVMTPSILWVVTVTIVQFRDRALLKKIWSVAFAGLFVSLFLNMWWTLPMAAQVFAFNVQPEFGVNLSYTLERNSEHLSLPNLIRFYGYWGLYAQTLSGLPSFTIAAIYASGNTLLAFIGYALFVVSFIGVFLFRKTKPLVIFIIALAIVGLFLGKGVHKPFGEVYQFLTDHVSGFWIFRSPDYKWYPNFVIAAGLAFALTTAGLFKMFWPKKRIIAIFLPLLLWSGVMMYGYPLITGDIIEESSYQSATYPEYEQARAWFAERKNNGRVFILPQEANSYLEYNNGYAGTDFIYNVVPSNAGGIGGGTALTHALIRDMHFRLYREQTIPALYWKMLGVKYVLQRNDVNWTSYPEHLLMSSPESIAGSLKKAGLTRVAQFGAWDIYEVPGDASQATGFSSMVWVSGNIRALPDLARDYPQTSENAFLYFSDFDAYPLPAPPSDALIYIKIPFTSREHLLDHEGWIFRDDDYADGEVTTSIDYAKDGENMLTYQVTIPQTRDYQLFVTLQYGADQGRLQFRVDGQDWQEGVAPIDKQSHGYDHRKTRLGQFHLEAGEHSFSIRNTSVNGTSSYQTVENIFFESPGASEFAEPQMLQKDILSPTHQTVRLEPGVKYLHFTESYHPYWQMKGATAQHILGFGYANGWVIDAKDQTTVVDIHYAPQRLLIGGAVISVLTALALLGFFLYHKMRLTNVKL